MGTGIIWLDVIHLGESKRWFGNGLFWRRPVYLLHMAYSANFPRRAPTYWESWQSRIDDMRGDTCRRSLLCFFHEWVRCKPFFQPTRSGVVEPMFTISTVLVKSLPHTNIVPYPTDRWTTVFYSTGCGTPCDRSLCAWYHVGSRLHHRQHV